MNIDAIEAAWEKAVAEDATASFEIIDMLIDNAPSLIAGARKAERLRAVIDNAIDLARADEDGQGATAVLGYLLALKFKDFRP